MLSVNELVVTLPPRHFESRQPSHFPPLTILPSLTLNSYTLLRIPKDFRPPYLILWECDLNMILLLSPVHIVSLSYLQLIHLHKVPQNKLRYSPDDNEHQWSSTAFSPTLQISVGIVNMNETHYSIFFWSSVFLAPPGPKYETSQKHISRKWKK